MARRNITSKTKQFVGDFETTVYDGQTETEVWASALVELYTDDVYVLHSIDETFELLSTMGCSVIVYYHNLKFDGVFWIDWLMRNGFEQAYTVNPDNPGTVKFCGDYEMKSGQFKYKISDMGQWYSIRICTGNRYIELRDSLKLLPFSVKQIGKSFKTRHQKLEMQYEGVRYAGCYISPEERGYIENDVLVVKEALEIFFNNGHNKTTIGSCCMAEYKAILRTMSAYDYSELFPQLHDISCPVEGFENAWGYVRGSYRGGWCYLVKGKENRVFSNGVTADVNSLYPSVMHSQSGCYYPVGVPHFWEGEIPDIVKRNMHTREKIYYFIQVKCMFKLKDGYLPFIQIKGNPLYNSREMLETSDIYDRKNKCYSHYVSVDGGKKEVEVVMTMTCTDYILFKEHYGVYNEKVLSGCYFYTLLGIFDAYIDKYKEIKMHSVGAVRTLAKLFLNNLYGKLATNDDSSFKIAEMTDDIVHFMNVEEHEKTCGYIACGSAITSYARNFTIRAAQKNYHGADNPGFIYADTDSIHCDIPADRLVGVPQHPTEFCHWKIESSWDRAIFVRPKTYIEHVVCEDLEPIDSPYYNIKCAGMSERSKNVFKSCLEGKLMMPDKDLTDAAREFIYDEDGNIRHMGLTDFKVGLCVPCKLMPRRIKGGVVLVETLYEIR